MAIQTFREIFIPEPHYYSGYATTTTLQLNADGYRVCLVFCAPRTGSIDAVAWRTGTVTVAETVRVGIYTVGSDGKPTDTPVGTVGTQATPATATGYVTALAASASVTKGTYYAIGFQIDSYSSGDLSIACQQYFSDWALPATWRYAGSWTQTTDPVMATPRFNDSPAYLPLGNFIFSTAAAQTINPTTGVDEVALRFKLPFPARVSGAWYYGQPAASSVYDVILYEGTTARATKSVDGDLSPTSERQRIQFDTAYDISANTTYYMSIKPTTSTVAVQVATLSGNLASIGLGGALPGGAEFYYIDREGSGDWNAADVNKIPIIGLILEGFDDAVGGSGGLITHPGMSGGMRG